LKVDVEIATLPIGDAIIGDIYVIERKRSDDFVASMLDGRLISQARRLMASAPRTILVAEGGDFATRAVHNNAISGMLALLVAEIGLSVVPTKDTKGTARLIAMLAKRCAKKQRKQSELLQERLRISEDERILGIAPSPWTIVHASGGSGTKRLEPMQQEKKNRELRRGREKLLQSIIGIGPIRARRLLDEYHTPIRVLTLGKDEWIACGISPQRAEKIALLIGRNETIDSVTND